MESMTSSAGIALLIPAIAICALTAALTAPAEFRLIHGTSTRPQTGSQVSPNIFLRANAAAFAIHSASPPCRYASPPAAIALAEPISAWHPPDAPAMLAFSAITAPIPALTKSASTIRFSVSLQYSSYDKNTAGITPHAPAVGAATIRFIQALDSPIFTAFSITSPMYPPARLRPEALYACSFSPSPPAIPLAETIEPSYS